MDEIINSLMQAIEEAAFPYFYKHNEYRQAQYCMMQESQWLEEHLSAEEKAHLEQLRQAELNATTLERQGQIRLALAAGIQFALPSA